MGYEHDRDDDDNDDVGPLNTLQIEKCHVDMNMWARVLTCNCLHLFNMSKHR